MQNVSEIDGGAEMTVAQNETIEVEEKVKKRNKSAKRITFELDAGGLDILDAIGLELINRGLVAPHELSQTTILRACIYSHPITPCNYERGMDKMRDNATTKKGKK